MPLTSTVTAFPVVTPATEDLAGGSVRWPLYANGRIVGTTFGWTVVLGLFTDTEVLAVLQYLSHYAPWLYSGSSLSASGIGIAAALEAVLVVLNWFGIRLFARLNLVITWIKFIVPTITVIALFASGFHGSNLTSAGGFAPYGGSAHAAPPSPPFTCNKDRNCRNIQGITSTPSRSGMAQMMLKPQLMPIMIS
jgi:amino acid transporter